MLVLAATACSGGIDDRAFEASQRAADGSAGAAGVADDPATMAPAGMSATEAPRTPEPAPPAPPAPSEFGVPPRCTSGSYYVNHEAEDDRDDDRDHDEYEVEGSPRMHPGRACIACHSTYDGPEFTIGGTVYPTAHEPDDCESPSTAGAQVVITDATGREIVLEVNAVGNFRSREGEHIVMPIRAKVVHRGRERAMLGARMSGDCNSCHTQAGDNGAPGRILAP